jgi:acyl transferase domain-containing protein
VWPASGLRRVSVNSFGFGGSNTHVVLDDAYHYLRDRHLSGNHCTSPGPEDPTGDWKPIANGNDAIHAELAVNGNGNRNGNGAVHPLNGSSVGPALNGVNGHGSTTKEDSVNGLQAGAVRARRIGSLPRMMVWTAADENALKRTVGVYQKYYQERVSGNPDKLDRLAHTLACRRSQMLWRTFALVADGPEPQGGKALSPAKPVRSSAENGLAFIFTGQGAQYAGKTYVPNDASSWVEANVSISSPQTWDATWLNFLSFLILYGVLMMFMPAWGAHGPYLVR